ncbi:hypothetical protein FN846DRAFT_908586 [Sphaerosporella brunnea]|uniref:Uncharacterized protein n=1 Tax=Sphaerosporella brunnea TaxID=1250544 RepID=A0A5J5ET85_9PEZI|nr:hypothetical protein FN846DRAFT_908586 [Sphaerosporella brunnea]
MRPPKTPRHKGKRGPTLSPDILSSPHAPTIYTPPSKGAKTPRPTRSTRKAAFPESPTRASRIGGVGPAARRTAKSNIAHQEGARQIAPRDGLADAAASVVEGAAINSALPPTAPKELVSGPGETICNAGRSASNRIGTLKEAGAFTTEATRSHAGSTTPQVPATGAYRWRSPLERREWMMDPYVAEIARRHRQGSP